MKLYVYFIGKPKNEHSNAIAEEFMKRSGRYSTCAMREIIAARFDLFQRHPTARKIFLDPEGKLIDSKAFTSLVAAAEQDGRDLVFLIGGHDGLPPAWKPKADVLLSLSPMTLPHELARAMLTEQIYRAFTTLRGHPYPR